MTLEVNGTAMSGEGKTPDDAASDDALRVLQRKVDLWFVRRGVPLFGDYSPRDVVPVVLPWIVVVFALEVAAVPWFDFDALVDSVGLQSVGPTERALVVNPVCLASLLAALLVALAGSRRLSRGIAATSPSARSGTGRTRMRQAATKLTALLGLVPIAFIIFVLVGTKALPGFGFAGWLEIFILLLLVSAATNAWFGGLSRRDTYWAAAALVVLSAWVWAEKGWGDDRPELFVFRSSFLVAPAALYLFYAARESHGQSRWPVAPMLLAMLAFQTTVAPYVMPGWAIVVFVAIPLALLGFRRVCVTPRILKAALAGRDRLPWSALMVIAAAFVLVPALLILMIEDRSIRSWESAATVALGNALTLAGVVCGASIGLHAVFSWASGEFARQVRRSGKLIAEAAPLVFIFIFFFLFTTETWELAAVLSPSRFWGLVAILIAVGLIIVIIKVAGAVEAKLRFNSRGTAKAAVEKVDDPAIRQLLAAVPERPRLNLPLTAVERANLVFIVAVKWAMPVLFVSMIVTGLIFLVAVVSVHADLLEAWEVDHGGRTAAALAGRVAVFLGAFSAVHFLAQVLREIQRRSFEEDIAEALDRRLAVLWAYRNVYGGPAVTEAPAVESGTRPPPETVVS